MEKTIRNPYWGNQEKTQVICEFVIGNQVQQVAVMDTENGNPDWKEIFETFTEEEITANTERGLREREKRREEQKIAEEEAKERAKTDALFAIKLEAFEIEAIRNSKNRKLKSAIRKAQSMLEVSAYTTLLLMEELNNESAN